MLVNGMNHFTVLSTNVERTTRFYCDLLDLETGYRPPFDFDGAWLYTADQAVLHIIGTTHPPQPPAGVIDHVAFSATDVGAALDRLEAAQISAQVRKQRGSGVWQVFFHDPDGAKLELNFPSHETVPERHAAKVT